MDRAPWLFAIEAEAEEEEVVGHIEFELPTRADKDTDMNCSYSCNPPHLATV